MPFLLTSRILIIGWYFYFTILLRSKFSAIINSWVEYPSFNKNCANLLSALFNSHSVSSKTYTIIGNDSSFSSHKLLIAEYDKLVMVLDMKCKKISLINYWIHKNAGKKTFTIFRR